MRSALCAPSSSLLEYLRIQSDVCFFSPSASFSFDHAVRQPRPCAVATRSSLRTRRLSTTAPRRATVEAGFLNFDSFWPRTSGSAKRLQGSEGYNGARSKKLASLTTQRTASTGSKKWNQKWYKKLWGVTGSKRGGPLQPDDLPSHLLGSEDGNDTSMFSLGRHISAKAAAQPKLRCTELDENGNVVLASGEFKKSELIAKVHQAMLILKWRC